MNWAYFLMIALLAICYHFERLSRMKEEMAAEGEAKAVAAAKEAVQAEHRRRLALEGDNLS